VVRGVTEDGKILNIAGDYIAHGIRARASEIVTLELGPQTEREVQQKIRQEVGQTASPASTPPSSRRSTTKA
jgi:type IV secretory pathway VirD2 relaxase